MSRTTASRRIERALVVAAAALAPLWQTPYPSASIQSLLPPEFAAVPAFDHVERPFTAGHVENQNFAAFGVALDGIHAVFWGQGVELGHVADNGLVLQVRMGPPAPDVARTQWPWSR